LEEQGVLLAGEEKDPPCSATHPDHRHRKVPERVVLEEVLSVVLQRGPVRGERQLGLREKLPVLPLVPVKDERGGVFDDRSLADHVRELREVVLDDRASASLGQALP
jgi:hypothetical protein